MTAARTVRRNGRRATVHDPIERRLHNRQRRESAPEGFITRRALCEKVGLTDHQFRALAKVNVITSDGVNGSGYALYQIATVERLIAMKGDGTLFRHLSSHASTTNTTPSHPTVRPTLHYSAEDGVRVFELLDAGETIKSIIVKTRIHPMLVKAISVDYDDLTGSIHLTKDIVDRLNDFGRAGRLPGAFPVRDGADVIAVVETCAVDRTCSTCETNAALTSCEECLVKERRAALAGMARSA